MEKSKSRGIVVEGGDNNLVRGNFVAGHDEGVVLRGGSNNQAIGNTVLSADAARLFGDAEKAIQASTLSRADIDKLFNSLAAMKLSVGSKMFTQRYKEFMAIAADHIGVLAPTLGLLLPQFAALVS